VIALDHPDTALMGPERLRAFRPLENAQLVIRIERTSFGALTGNLAFFFAERGLARHYLLPPGPSGG
jgi:hypothetical protein